MSVRKDRGARGRLGGPPDPKSGLSPGAGETKEEGRKGGREGGREAGRMGAASITGQV